MKTSDSFEKKEISTAEQNKKLLQNVVEEIWNNGNFENIGDMVSSDFTIHLSRPGEELRGPEEIKQFYTNLRKAFPDIRFHIVNQVAEGDKVVTQWTAEGTHKGEFKGIPATGRKVNFNAIDIDKISRGKFVECWSNMDELGLMQQLGVIPSQS